MFGFYIFKKTKKDKNMLIAATLPKLPNKPVFMQNRQTIQNHYNDSYYKDTVHFSGKQEITDKTDEKTKYSVMLPREQAEKLFKKAKKENIEAKDVKTKHKILLNTVKAFNDIYEEFMLDEYKTDLPQEHKKTIDKHIHRVKSPLYAMLFLHKEDKNSYELPDDYDYVCGRTFFVILNDIEDTQENLKLPDKAEPKTKYAVMLPREKLKKLFDETDKKNRETQNAEEKKKILIEVIRAHRDIWDNFVTEELTLDKPLKYREEADLCMHRTKSDMDSVRKLFKKHQKSEISSSDYNKESKETFDAILTELYICQPNLKLPDEAKPSRKAREDST